MLLSKRFDVLDSFRGLAAIFVVIYHMRFVGSITELSFFKGSYLFVEFFFVLSGFVLAYGYHSKINPKFRDFFITRTFRILPLHAFVLIIMILLEFGKLLAYKNGFHFYSEPFTNKAQLSDIVPNLFLLQAWLPGAYTFSWNFPSWSISVEYYMYMIFFVTLMFANNFRYLFWSFISLTMFMLIFINIDIGMEVIRGLSCFFLGAITYLVYKNTYKKIRLHKHYFSLIEVILLLLVVAIVSSNLEYKSLIASALFSGTVFVFAFEMGCVSKIFKHDLLIRLGKLSYSIYMTQAVVLFIIFSVVKIAQKTMNFEFIITEHKLRYIDLGNTVYNNIAIIFTILIIVLLSRLTHKYIEQKGQNIGKRLKF